MPTEIKFSPGGNRFSIVSLQTVDIWTISKAGLEKRITCTSKPTTVQWVDDERIIVGLENGNIITLTITDTQANTYHSHKQRVKCLYYENGTLYSASSSGELKVWSVNDLVLQEICSYNAACRVTCITLNRQNHLMKKEDKSDEECVDEEKLNKQEQNIALHEEIEVSRKIKRKSGAFVSISYGGDDNEHTKESIPPPTKKIKKRKRNKKVKAVTSE